MGTLFEVDNTGNVDVKNNQVKNIGRLRMQNLTADPATPTQGDVYYNSTAKKLKVHDGTSFVNIGGAGLLFSGVNSNNQLQFFSADNEVWTVMLGLNNPSNNQKPGSTYNINTGVNQLSHPHTSNLSNGGFYGAWMFGKFTKDATTLLQLAPSAGVTYFFGSNTYHAIDSAPLLHDAVNNAGTITIRYSESVIVDPITLNPNTGFNAFGTLYSTTELNNWNDTSYRTTNSGLGSGGFYSLYVLRVTGITKSKIMGLGQMFCQNGSFVQPHGYVRLWNFNTNAWDGTVGGIQGADAYAEGNSAFGGGGQYVVGACIADDATNYVSSGTSYVAVYFATSKPSSGSAAVFNIGYIGLLEYNGSITKP